MGNPAAIPISVIIAQSGSSQYRRSGVIPDLFKMDQAETPDGKTFCFVDLAEEVKHDELFRVPSTQCSDSLCHGSNPWEVNLGKHNSSSTETIQFDRICSR